MFVEEQPKTAVELPITLAIPATDAQLQKAPADPGTHEVLNVPEHVYLYWVVEDALHNITVESIKDTVLTANEWHYSSNPTQFQTAGDPVYMWSGNIVRMLPESWQTIRLYAAASPLSLELSSTPTNESDIRSLKFIVSPELHAQVRDLYATPYNYEINDTYYATIRRSRDQKVAQLHLLLYHVAAKVDLKWKVQEDKRGEQRLTLMRATGLYNQEAYLFQHNNNTLAAIPDGYSYEILNGDIGLQWEGRSYFYTIPYTVGGKFPLRLVCEQNDDATDYTLTLLKDMTAADKVFTPWLRGNLNFTGQLTGNRDIDISE